MVSGPRAYGQSVPKGGSGRRRGTEPSTPLPPQGLGEYAACQSNAFMKGIFTFITGRLGPGVL